MRSRGSLVPGLIIIAIGIVFLLDNLNITQITIGSLFANFWPLIVILIGLNFIFGQRSFGGMVIGLILIAWGVTYLGDNLDWFHVDFSWFWNVFWPVIIILVGISFLTGYKRSGKMRWAFMGGVNRTEYNWELKNGDYSAFMGGIKLDLRKADIVNQETHITISTFMGGAEIIVPSDLTVVCEGTSFMGGMNFFGKKGGGLFGQLEAKQGNGNDGGKVVHISCHSFMGGVDIKTL